MRAGLRISLFLLPVILIIVSCTDENFSIGGNFIDKEMRIVYIDTSTVKMSTVTIDSLVTSGNEMILAGRYGDTITGITSSTAFLTYSVPGITTFPESREIIFDSVDMVMVLNGESTGDTTTYHTFNIYPLLEAIELPVDEEFYNTDKTDYSPSPIASFTIKPKPETGDTLTVRLPDDLGNDLLNIIVNDDKEVLGTQDRFSAYFKGLAVGPGELNNCILGFFLSDTSMSMKIYYHYIESSRIVGNVTISPLKPRSFYGTQTDRSGTIFWDLHKNEISSKLTKNIAFAQSLTATCIKFEIPYLNNLLETGDIITVTEAKLKIKPLKGTYSKVNPLPPSLSMYILDKNDVTMGYLANSSENDLQTGNLVVDDVLDFETYYSYTITEYINNQLGSLENDKKNMTIMLPQNRISKCLSTLILGNNPQEPNIELQISYMIYNDK
jgi:hypothetical protein